jgi:hypothetical protein
VRRRAIGCSRQRAEQRGKSPRTGLGIEFPEAWLIGIRSTLRLPVNLKMARAMNPAGSVERAIALTGKGARRGGLAFA